MTTNARYAMLSRLLQFAVANDLNLEEVYFSALEQELI